jgi:hypothetical protein
MTKPIHSILTGQAYRDRDGQRWSVKCPRPGAEGQYVIEAEMKGSYPRVAVYAMTEREFHEHARAAELKPEQSGRGARQHHQRHHGAGR